MTIERRKQRSFGQVGDALVEVRSCAARGTLRRRAAALLAIIVALTAPAQALEIELRDFAPDRVERQRAYTRGEMPLPATPKLQHLDARLAAKGLAKGNPIFIRIFKASSELELWMQKGDRFTLLDTYPICHWTGTLGPKLREGDKQSPEGFYSVANRQMRLVGRWQKAFNIGYPNPYDQHAKRTGSFILIHGGCSSVGCYAMTEQVQEEIYALADAAIKAGQQRFHVQVFPFRMTPQAMEVFEGHTWLPFWNELKVGYDSFERTRIPPRVGLCGERYHVTDGEAGEVGASTDLLQLPRNGSSCTPAISARGSARLASQQSMIGDGNSDDEVDRPARRKPQRNQSAKTDRSSLGSSGTSGASDGASAGGKVSRSTDDGQEIPASPARRLIDRYSSGG